jgi:hypothetical protein
MKSTPTPPPDVPGKTPEERLSNALSMVLTVSKTDLLKKEAQVKRSHPPKRNRKYL